MRIALISARRDPFISPVDMDGGCVMLRNYIRQLWEMGHEVHVFTRLEIENPSDNKLRQLKARAQKEAGIGKVKIKNRLYSYRVPYERFPDALKSDISQIEESRSFISNLKSYFTDDGFDIYHYFHLFSISGWLMDGGFIPYLKKTVFSPLLLTKGRTFEYPTKARLRLEKYVCKKVKHIVCLSKREVDMLKSSYDISEEKLFKIPLGISARVFYPKKFTKKFLERKKYVLISPNAIRAQKRQIEVCKIAAFLKSKDIACVTVFVGKQHESEYYKKVLEIINQCGLTCKNVEYPITRKKIISLGADILFIDGVHQKDLASTIRLADLAILPSLDESFGLILLECMACGTPPVCFNLKAYKEYLIPGENAIAVKRNLGWQGLANAAEEILRRPVLHERISKIATNMSSQFSWRNLVSQQITIYSRIMDDDQKDYKNRHYMASWVNLHK